jgi:propanol-preferring alcohol dehydrogenase
LTDIKKPEPGNGEVVVKMKASGVCHSDLHVIDNDWPFVPKLPIIPGHEGVGLVETVGTSTQRLKVGDRVAVWGLNRTCGRCRLCLSGEENLCQESLLTGFSVDGTFAEFSKISGDFAVKIPEGLNDVDASPITDAGVTALRAVRLAKLEEDDPVVIFGTGGVGHLACQFAKLTGAFVIAVDIGNEKLRLAEQLGVNIVLDATDPSLRDKLVREFGGMKAAICCAPSLGAYSQAVRVLRRGGALIAIGLPPGALDLSIIPTVVKGLQIKGSFIGTRQDLTEALSLAAQHRLRPIVKTYAFDDVNNAIRDLRNGKVSGRPVLVF